MYDYNMKSPLVDKCLRYSYYYTAGMTATNIKRGLNLSDYTWNCEACSTGYWLLEDTTSTSETNTPA